MNDIIRHEIQCGLTLSADAKGIYGRGTSSDSALQDFRSAVECRVCDQLGGTYLGPSEKQYQNDYFNDLENNCDDGVRVVRDYKRSVAVFISQ